MAAAPPATLCAPVYFPASSAQQQPRPSKPVYLTIKADLSLAIGGEAITANSLVAALDAATGSNKDERIFLRADRSVPYGAVMQVMNDLRAADYLKVALVGLETRDAK